MTFCCCTDISDIKVIASSTQRTHLDHLQSLGLHHCCRPVANPSVPPPLQVVRLNVYHIVDAATNNKIRRVGFGLYHSGVEVYGLEWSYGEAVDEHQVSGLFHVSPRHAMISFFRSIDIGTTNCSPEQVDTMLHRLENEWKSGEYHVLGHNCNDFSECFLKMLTPCEEAPLEMPAWVNRAARWSNRIVPQKAATWAMRKMDEQPPVSVIPRSVSSIGELPSSVVPVGWYRHRRIAKASRYIFPLSTSNAGREPPIFSPLKPSHKDPTTDHPLANITSPPRPGTVQDRFNAVSWPTNKRNTLMREDGTTTAVEEQHIVQEPCRTSTLSLCSTQTDVPVVPQQSELEWSPTVPLTTPLLPNVDILRLSTVFLGMDSDGCLPDHSPPTGEMHHIDRRPPNNASPTMCDHSNTNLSTEFHGVVGTITRSSFTHAADSEGSGVATSITPTEERTVFTEAEAMTPQLERSVVQNRAENDNVVRDESEEEFSPREGVQQDDSHEEVFHVHQGKTDLE